jgi:hypothetical protein
VVELRSLKREDSAPSGDAWVLIEKHDRLYSITARQNGASVDASVSPPAFDTPEAAMQAATTWADLLSVPVIYLRDDA